MRPDVFLTGIRRAILTAHDEDTSLPAATAEVAAYWSRRRAERGASPADVASTEVLVLQVGADLAHELAA